MYPILKINLDRQSFPLSLGLPLAKKIFIRTVAIKNGFIQTNLIKRFCFECLPRRYRSRWRGRCFMGFFLGGHQTEQKKRVFSGPHFYFKALMHLSDLGENTATKNGTGECALPTYPHHHTGCSMLRGTERCAQH